MSMQTHTHTKWAYNFYFCSRGTFVTGVIRAECVLTPSEQTTTPNLSLSFSCCITQAHRKALASRTLSNSPIKLPHSSRCSETPGCTLNEPKSPFYTNSHFKGAPYRANSGRNGPFQSFHDGAHANFKSMPDMVKA